MKFLLIINLVIISILQISCADYFGKNESKEYFNQDLKLISSQKKMLEIEGGSYEAFFGKDSGRIVRVETFFMDDSPITNAEYLDFLKANPQWTKTKVLELYAGKNYLKNWKSDYEIPTNQSPDSPVTNISWYAAEAYAKSVGKRLPTIDEWEYVGLASADQKNASSDPVFSEFILKAYQERKRNGEGHIKKSVSNYYGIYNMYDLVWEWTYDFNSVMISGESRNDSTPSESLFCAGAAVTSADLRNYAAFVRYALRGSVKANDCINNLGFRCVKNE
jgi:formylglycine-generating enzyme required for sulfatase activity